MRFKNVITNYIRNQKVRDELQMFAILNDIAEQQTSSILYKGGE
jgi:hypothetical protein